MRPRPPLSMAVAQPRCAAHDLAANARHHAECVRSARARVVVFPELSLTGYHFDAAPLGVDDGALGALVEACDHIGTLALVGAPEEIDGRRYIAMWAVDGDGVRSVYRKIWLGSAEEPHFHAGREPAVLVVDRWRLGLGICKDTGMAQHAADTAAVGMDVYVAGALETPDDAELLADRARRIARDHGVWVAIASFAAGTGEGYAPAGGRSGIWRPDGAEAARAGDQVGAVVGATMTAWEEPHRHPP